MPESQYSLIFQKSHIAELNSIMLFDYENSFKNYYNKEQKSSFSLKYFKWFDHSKFDKNRNSFLNDFEEYISKNVI